MLSGGYSLVPEGAEADYEIMAVKTTEGFEASLRLLMVIFHGLLLNYGSCSNSWVVAAGTDKRSLTGAVRLFRWGEHPTRPLL